MQNSTVQLVWELDELREMSADWSAMRSCVLEAPRRLLDVRSETESDDAVCNWSQLSRCDRCSLDSPHFRSVLCLFLWRPLCGLQWNFGSARPRWQHLKEN